MPTIKTSQQILSEQKQFVRARNPVIDVSDGSVASQFALVPNSVGGEIIGQELLKAVNLQILANLSGADLDNEGTNYGIYRMPGSKATGNVIFISRVEPTDNIVIPANTRVSTAGTTLAPGVVFLTSRTVVMLYSQRASYYNPETGWWEIEVDVIAESYGSSGNVGVERITIMLTPITGVDAVTNREATTGGEDAESDARLRSRIRSKMLGREIGVKNGIEAFILSNINFPDVKAILPSSTDSERVDGTDVFVIDESSREVSEEFEFFPSQRDYQLAYTPVIDISTVQGSSAGILDPLTDYELHSDITSTKRFSPLAYEFVRLTATGLAKMTSGETMTVVYAYPSSLHDAWDLIRNPENLIIFADPYIKKAIKWTVDIKATVTFFSNVDTITEKQNIENALNEFLGQYRLGDPIQRSDLEIAIQTGYGDYPISSVDQVTISEIKATSSLGEVRYAVGDTINLDGKGYARLGSITFL
jgi:uncharacterized phage protein gp47/JayE